MDADVYPETSEVKDKERDIYIHEEMDQTPSEERRGETTQTKHFNMTQSSYYVL